MSRMQTNVYHIDSGHLSVNTRGAKHLPSFFLPSLLSCLVCFFCSFFCSFIFFLSFRLFYCHITSSVFSLSLSSFWFFKYRLCINPALMTARIERAVEKMVDMVHFDLWLSRYFVVIWDDGVQSGY
jgi:hypothetical protein